MKELSAIFKEVAALEQRLAELKGGIRQKLVKKDLPEGDLALLLVEAANEQIGLPIKIVEEVIPMCKLAACPDAPEWMPGLLNFRGAMLPAIDLTARIQKQSRKPQLTDFIAICNNDNLRFCLIVQGVHQVYKTSAQALEDVSADLPIASYMLGFFHLEHDVVFLLSLSCLIETSILPKEPA